MVNEDASFVCTRVRAETLPRRVKKSYLCVVAVVASMARNPARQEKLALLLRQLQLAYRHAPSPEFSGERVWVGLRPTAVLLDPIHK